MKLAQRVWANRVAIIGHKQPTISALSGKHVEVVGPEIDQHFLQLSLAVNRSQNSRSLQLRRNTLRRAVSIFSVVVANHSTILFVSSLGFRIAVRVFFLLCIDPVSLRSLRWLLPRCSVSPCPQVRSADRRGVEADVAFGRAVDISRTTPRSSWTASQILDLCLRYWVRNSLRVQLLVDVPFNPDCFHSLNVSRTRAKSEPI